MDGDILKDLIMIPKVLKYVVHHLLVKIIDGPYCGRDKGMGTTVLLTSWTFSLRRCSLVVLNLLILLVLFHSIPFSFVMFILNISFILVLITQ